MESFQYQNISKITKKSHLCKNEDRLYKYIKYLSRKDGYCTATNKYFSDYFQTSIKNVERHISELKRLHYIDCDTKTPIGRKNSDGSTRWINDRKIYICNDISVMKKPRKNVNPQNPQNIKKNEGSDRISENEGSENEGSLILNNLNTNTIPPNPLEGEEGFKYIEPESAQKKKEIHENLTNSGNPPIPRAPLKKSFSKNNLTKRKSKNLFMLSDIDSFMVDTDEMFSRDETICIFSCNNIGDIRDAVRFVGEYPAKPDSHVGLFYKKLKDLKKIRKVRQEMPEFFTETCQNSTIVENTYEHSDSTRSSKIIAFA